MGRIWVIFLLLGCGWGQAPVRGPKMPLARPGVVPAAAAVVLRAAAAQAGVIFAGHVVDVQHNDASGYVDVVFAIDRAVRGCDAASRYVLREWAGLWAEEPQRYGVGQRLLMILAARGPSGMSAPVGGMAGKIPLVGVRPAVVARAGVAPADAGAAVEEAADLRWVEAAAMRSVSPGSKARAEVLKSVGSGWSGPVEQVEVSSGLVGLGAVLAVFGGN